MEQGNKRQNLTVKCVVWDKREIIVSSSVYPVNTFVCVCVLKSHFKGFLPIPLPWAVSPRRPLPASWITRSEYFLSVSTLILTCTVLLDPQPEGRHSGGMRIREGDESARSGLGVSSGSSSKVWEARCGWRPRREPMAG